MVVPPFLIATLTKDRRWRESSSLNSFPKNDLKIDSSNLIKKDPISRTSSCRKYYSSWSVRYISEYADWGGILSHFSYWLCYLSQFLMFSSTHFVSNSFSPIKLPRYLTLFIILKQLSFFSRFFSTSSVSLLLIISILLFSSGKWLYSGPISHNLQKRGIQFPNYLTPHHYLSIKENLRLEFFSLTSGTADVLTHYSTKANGHPCVTPSLLCKTRFSCYSLLTTQTEWFL